MRLLLLSFLLPIAAIATTLAHAATVAIACGAVGQEAEICRDGAQAWARQTGNEVKLVSTPASGTERLTLYLQLLAAGSRDLDVLQIDVIWPGMLAEHLVDLSAAARDVAQAHFPALIENDTVGGRLVALPWFTDVGLLYFRKDLLDRYGLKPPQTWDELVATARKIQAAERAAGRAKLWGFVWQGRAYEGLTCNALEWVASNGGGAILDATGRITIDNPQAASALTMAAAWVGDITPRGVLNYGEEEARGVFQAGDAVFMRNWPYAWALLESEGSPLRGRVGVTQLPRGPSGAAATTLGGQQLAVSRYSKHPDLAIDLVRYLTGRAEQKRRALLGAFYPTIPALYRDVDARAQQPLAATVFAALQFGVARPAHVAGRRYNRVSAAFWNTAHAVLSGRDARSELEELSRRLVRVSRGQRW